MPTKKNKPMSPAEQQQKFVTTARELECDESLEAFDRMFGKIVPPKPDAKTPKTEGGE